MFMNTHTHQKQNNKKLKPLLVVYVLIYSTNVYPWWLNAMPNEKAIERILEQEDNSCFAWEIWTPRFFNGSKTSFLFPTHASWLASFSRPSMPELLGDNTDTLSCPTCTPHDGQASPCLPSPHHIMPHRPFSSDDVELPSHSFSICRVY